MTEITRIRVRVSEREKRLRLELDAERHRNRHLLLLVKSLSASTSRLSVENYELRYGKRYPIPGQGLSPDNALGLNGTDPEVDSSVIRSTKETG